MKVFISHSSDDKEVIKEFVKVLRILNIEVFYSSNAYTNSIDFGEDFYMRIKKEINESDYVFSMVSSNFYHSIPCQVEMGISYALDKKIIPIIIEKEFKFENMLRGIFSVNNRALNIYNKKELKKFLLNFKNNPLEIDEYVEDIFIYLSEQSGKKVNKHTIAVDNINGIEEFIKDGELNIEECLFLKYMWEKRKYHLEYGNAVELGVNRFKEYLVCYYLENSIDIIYRDIIKHFSNLGMLDVYKYDDDGNIKEYKLRREYVIELNNIFEDNPDLINRECSKAVFEMPF